MTKNPKYVYRIQALACRVHHILQIVAPMVNPLSLLVSSQHSNESELPILLVHGPTSSAFITSNGTAVEGSLFTTDHRAKEPQVK